MKTRQDSPPTGNRESALLRALRHLLRPLVRLLIAEGVTYPQLIAHLKSLYVEVAERDFRLEGRPQTDSRLTLLTGVHRKDVRRLASAAEADSAMEAVPASVSLGAQLVALWTTDPEYLSADGQPKPLARLARDGGDASFEVMVERISKDIRSRAVLDEWLRLGIVVTDEQERVILNVHAFVPRKGSEERMFYLGHNLHDHIAAAGHNVRGGQPPFLDRVVHYDALTLESVERLTAMAEASGMRALKEINKEAMRLERRDRASSEARQRITFGVFFYHAPTQQYPQEGES